MVAAVLYELVVSALSFSFISISLYHDNESVGPRVTQADRVSPPGHRFKDMSLHTGGHILTGNNNKIKYSLTEIVKPSDGSGTSPRNGASLPQAW